MGKGKHGVLCRLVACLLGAVSLVPATGPALAMNVPLDADCLSRTILDHDGHVFRVPGLIESEPGVTLAFCQVYAKEPQATGQVIVLVHASAAGSVAVFDLDVPRYSLAEDLARAGHLVVLYDARGFGASTRPASATPQPGAPGVTLDEALRDLGAVVDEARRLSRSEKIVLAGFDAGSTWAAAYAERHADNVSHLVLVGPMTGTAGPWKARMALERPARPGKLDDTLGGCRPVDAKELISGWPASKTDGPQPEARVAVAFVWLALLASRDAHKRSPVVFCQPTAVLAEHYGMAQGKKLWNPAQIRIPTLAVRAENDTWSRPEDMAALRDGLSQAPRREIVELVGAERDFLLQPPERGRAAFLEALASFLK